MCGVCSAQRRAVARLSPTTRSSIARARGAHSGNRLARPSFLHGEAVRLRDPRPSSSRPAAEENGARGPRDFRIERERERDGDEREREREEGRKGGRGRESAIGAKERAGPVKSPSVVEGIVPGAGLVPQDRASQPATYRPPSCCSGTVTDGPACCRSGAERG